MPAALLRNVSVALACGALAACTLLTARDGLQCRTTADCRALGPSFAATRCSPQGICEAVRVPEAGTSLACSSSADCAFVLGASGRCSGGACLPVPRACTTIGPFADDAALLFGVLLPRAGDAATQTGELAMVLDALVGDWNDSVTSAPKLAALVCDEAQFDASVAAMQSFQVKFVLGPASDKALGALLNQSALTVMSPFGDAASFVSTPDTKRRQWFCSPNRASADKAFASAIGAVASRVAADGALPAVKVAVAFNGQMPNEVDFVKKVRASLTINGQRADQQPSQYVETDVNLDVDDPGATAAVPALQVANQRPHVVAISGALWARRLVDGIETKWDFLAPGVPHPTYVVFHAPPAVESFVQSDLSGTPWDGRVYALDVDRQGGVAATHDLLRSFLARSLLIPREPFGVSAFSDCFYAGVYGTLAGAASAGVPAVSAQATQVSTGLLQLSQGSTEIRLAYDDIPAMLGLVQTKARAVMIGSNARLGFDATSGVPASPLGLQCLASARSKTPKSWAFAGVRYDATTQESSGAIACP